MNALGSQQQHRQSPVFFRDTKSSLTAHSRSLCIISVLLPQQRARQQRPTENKRG
jgi:hypothetical protein